MTEPKRCIVCRGRPVYAVAVQVGEDGLAYAADVCVTCLQFHDVIAERIREQIPSDGGHVKPVIECPHCTTQVLPSASGQCPACGKNARDGTQSKYTSMTIHDGALLPAICYLCGSATERRVAIRRKWQASGDSWFAKVPAILLMLFTPVYFPLRILGLKPKPSVYVRLPQCASCSNIEAPNPRHVDFGAGEIVLVVHKNFKAAARGMP